MALHRTIKLSDVAKAGGRLDAEYHCHRQPCAVGVHRVEVRVVLPHEGGRALFSLKEREINDIEAHPDHHFTSYGNKLDGERKSFYVFTFAGGKSSAEYVAFVEGIVNTQPHPEARAL